MIPNSTNNTKAVPDWLDWLHDEAATVVYQRDKRGAPLYTVRVGGLRAVTASRLDVCVAALRASRRELGWEPKREGERESGRMEP